MYNLRFVLDENGKVKRCCFKEIPKRNEIDVLTYQDIIWDKDKLNKLIVFLLDSDLNHTTYRNNPNIHDFEVNESEIKSILRESRDYKNKMIIKKVNALESGKFTPTKKKEEPKKDQRKINRRNRFIGQTIVVSLSTLIILGSAIAIHKKDTSNYRDEVLQEATLPQDIFDIGKYFGNLNNNDLNNEEVNQRDEKYNIKKVIKEDFKEDTTEQSNIKQDIIVNDDYDETFNLYTTDNTNDQKFIDCYNMYYDLIEKYSNMYGIDPNLSIAIACQERGVHSDVVDAGGGLGLFQIQVEGGWNWEGKDVTAYHFETNSYESYTVKKENVKNVEENIKTGIMILQECLRRNDYNIALSVQEYNFGYSGVQEAIRLASEDLKMDRSNFDSVNHTEWINYRNQVGYGDSNYLENVFRYVHDDDVLHFKTPNGNEISVRFNNTAFEKMIKK